MNGIEKITEKIIADAKLEVEEVLAAAHKEAEVISDNFAQREEKERAALLEAAKRHSAERESRMVSVAELEGRKRLLSLKQEMIDQAFAVALDQLCHLPAAEYVDLLSQIAARSAQTGKEEIVLSPKDKEQYGQMILDKANAAKGLQLTLSAETRDIVGGLLLKQGDIEINCTLDTQVRLLRDDMALEIAHVLFE